MLRSLGSSVSRLRSFHQPLLLRVPQAASISTSKRKPGESVTADGGKGKKEEAPRVDDFSYEAAKKKWVSFGFHHEDPAEDIRTRNFFLFSTVTILLVGIGFLATYYPDFKRRDWYQRQAYIELARREALGLPPIDENLVPPENINLPSEEELGDFEIII